jgi:hypothetical protein
MPGTVNSKPIPRGILVIGASGHIGGPPAAFLHREAPQIHPRPASSSTLGREPRIVREWLAEHARLLLRP